MPNTRYEDDFDDEESDYEDSKPNIKAIPPNSLWSKLKRSPSKIVERRPSVPSWSTINNGVQGVVDRATKPKSSKKLSSYDYDGQNAYYHDDPARKDDYYDDDDDSYYNKSSSKNTRENYYHDPVDSFSHRPPPPPPSSSSSSIGSALGSFARKASMKARSGSIKQKPPVPERRASSNAVPSFAKYSRYDEDGYSQNKQRYFDDDYADKPADDISYRYKQHFGSDDYHRR